MKTHIVKSTRVHNANPQSRFRRIATGLFRYKRTGMIYGVFTLQGRTRWKRLNTNDRAQAASLLLEERVRLRSVDLTATHALTLGDILNFYERLLVGMSAGTAEQRRCLLRTFRSTWSSGFEMKVAQVTTADLRLWLASQRQRICAQTWNVYLRFLRVLFDQAIELKAITENPELRIKHLRIELAPRSAPTAKEFHDIVSNIHQQKFNARCEQSAELVEFMGLLGLGQAEVSNLRGEHFDFERQQITVVRQKTRKPFIIPMYPQAMMMLNRLRSEGRIAIGLPVFKTRTPEVALHRACSRLNLPRYSPRSLRRMFIVNALERGVDPRVLASWQGHRDATLILRVYGAWINSDHNKRMAALLT